MDGIDFNQTCRCCLLNTIDMKYLYDPYSAIMCVAEVFTSMTSLEVSGVQDKLPIKICRVCFCKLNLAYKFVLKCRESDKKLRKYLDNKDNRNITKPNSLSNTTQHSFSTNEHIRFANVDIKSEIDDFDPVPDDLLISPLNSDQIKLEYQTNNSKSFNDDAIVARNYERVKIIDETQNNLNELDILKHELNCDITENNINNRNGKVINTPPVYKQHSDEISEVHQLQESNRLENELEQDVTIGISDLGNKVLNQNDVIEQNCRTSNVIINQLGPKEGGTTRITTNKETPKYYCNQYIAECNSERISAQQSLWSEAETLTLINLYEQYKENFRNAKKRKHVWAIIAEHLASLGMMRSSLKCERKWLNLVRVYRAIKDEKNATGRGSSRFKFFDRMDEVLENRPSKSSSNLARDFRRLQETRCSINEKKDADISVQNRQSNSTNQCVQDFELAEVNVEISVANRPSNSSSNLVRDFGFVEAMNCTENEKRDADISDVLGEKNGSSDTDHFSNIDEPPVKYFKTNRFRQTNQERDLDKQSKEEKRDERHRERMDLENKKLDIELKKIEILSAYLSKK